MSSRYSWITISLFAILQLLKKKEKTSQLLAKHLRIHCKAQSLRLRVDNYCANITWLFKKGNTEN